VLHKETELKHDNFVAACARAGFTPRVSMEASEPLTALGLVAAGLGMAMIQNSLRHHAPAGVVLRELPWFTYRTPLWAAWHRVNLRPLVEIFREVLLEGARPDLRQAATAH
jgi:DNA-binding transcriptional LysR family regulator